MDIPGIGTVADQAALTTAAQSLFSGAVPADNEAMLNPLRLLSRTEANANGSNARLRLPVHAGAANLELFIGAALTAYAVPAGANAAEIRTSVTAAKTQLDVLAAAIAAL